MAIIIKSRREIELMKIAGKVMIGLFDELEKHTKPGISTAELDKIACRYIRSNGAIPACKGYEGFPGNICISVNDTLIHGIPSKKIILKDGDIVSYDCVVFKDGYNVDACRTFPVGNVKEETLHLLETTKRCFFEAVKLIKPGVHLGDISHKIEETATKEGYSLTEDYTGHGIGKEMHEDPYVPNVGEKGSGPILKEGMTLAIEPMVNEGKKDLYTLEDGWTVKTRDGKMCAHYENTIVVTKDGHQILTLKEGEEI